MLLCSSSILTAIIRRNIPVDDIPSAQSTGEEAADGYEIAPTLGSHSFNVFWVTMRYRTFDRKNTARSDRRVACMTHVGSRSRWKYPQGRNRL